jgi:hypothetical protein
MANVCIGLLLTLASEIVGLPANVSEHTVYVPRPFAEAAVQSLSEARVEMRDCEEVSPVVVILNDKVVFKMTAEPVVVGPW